MTSYCVVLALTLTVLKVANAQSQRATPDPDSNSTTPAPVTTYEDDCTNADLTSLTGLFNGLFMSKEDMGLGDDDILTCMDPDENGTRECVFAPRGDINLLLRTDKDCCCPTIWGWWVLLDLRRERVMQLSRWNMYQAYYSGRCLNRECMHVSGRCRQAYRVGTYIVRINGRWSVRYRSTRSHCRCVCPHVTADPNPTFEA